MMLVVASWLYSDSEMMSPAKNAPNDKESPMLEVKPATARQITIVLSRKSSLLRVMAIQYNNLGTTYRALTYTIKRMRKPLANKSRMENKRLSVSPVSMGVMSIIGTTIMS